MNNNDDDDAPAMAAQKKLVAYLDQKENFPVLIQNQIDTLITGFVKDLNKSIDVYERRCKPIIDDGLAVPAFIRKTNTQLLKEAVTPAVYAQKMSEAAIENQCNFDSDTDTEEQVRNFLLLYKEGYRDYPHKLYECKSLKSVLFIPTIAQLRIDRPRIGTEYSNNNGYNVIESLLLFAPKGLEAYKKVFDQRCVVVLKRLMKMGLIDKLDISTYNTRLFKILYADKQFFYKERFQFVASINPEQLYSLRLLFSSPTGTPLHFAASKESSIATFRGVFETGLRVYPKMIGINLLYKMNTKKQTTFSIACQVHGREKTMTAIQSSLIAVRTGTDRDRDDQPVAHCYDTAEALLYATVNPDIHLDAVYSMIRTQPGVLQQLLLPQKDSKIRKSWRGTRKLSSSSKKSSPPAKKMSSKRKR